MIREKRVKVYVYGGLLLTSLLCLHGCSNIHTEVPDPKRSETSNQQDGKSSDPLPSQTNSTTQSPTDNLQIQSDASFTALKMVSSNVGWAIANQKLLRTINGGNTWLSVNVGNLSISDSNGRCFYDENSVWITTKSGNKISVFATLDGGKNWITSQLPLEKDWESYGSQFLSFVDHQNGFVLVTSDASLGQMHKAIYKTIDGGHSFQRIGEVTSDIAGYPTGISFRDTQTGWMGCLYHGQDGIPLYKTVDGGRTWSRQTLPVPSDLKGYYGDVYTPQFFGQDKNQGILVIKFVHEGNTVIVPFTTSNGGISWVAHTGLKIGSIQLISFYNAQSGWALDNEHGFLYQTQDSGTTWSKRSDPILANAEQLSVVDEKTGWISGNNLLFKTTDGGQNWIKLK